MGCLSLLCWVFLLLFVSPSVLVDAQLSTAVLGGGSMNPAFASGVPATYAVEVNYPTSTLTPIFTGTGTITYTYSIAKGPWYLKYYNTAINPNTPYVQATAVGGTQPCTSACTATNGLPTPAIYLNPGLNVLTVTCGGGNYIFNIYRLSDDASISNMYCDKPLNPGWDPFYGQPWMTAASQPYPGSVAWVTWDTDTFTCRPTRSQLTPLYGSIQHQNIAPVGTPLVTVNTNTPFTWPLRTGRNLFQIKVQAEYSGSQGYYNILIHRLSHDSSLLAGPTGLTTTSGSLVPTFRPDWLSYTIYIAPAVASIQFTPNFNYTAAVVGDYNTVGTSPATTAIWRWENAVLTGPITGSILTGATSPSLAMVVGDNFLTLRVTAEDLNTTEYRVLVRRLSADTRLNTLVVTPTGTGLLPSFSPTVLAYDMQVPNAVSAVVFRMTPMYSFATMTWRLDADSSGVTIGADMPTPAIALPIGTNGDTKVVVQVKAEDLTSTANYVITIHRVSINASLIALTTGKGLDQPFQVGKLAYTVSTLSVTDSTLTVTATKAYQFATISLRLNGVGTGLPFAALTSGVQTSPYALLTGYNVFEVKVVSEDMVYTQTYTITVYFKTAASALLSLATTPPGFGLVPAFNSSWFSYTLLVPDPVDQITLTSTPSPTAFQQYQLGTNPLAIFTPGVPSPSIPIVYIPDSVIQIKVSAEDGVSYSIYTITVHRLWSDNSLVALDSSVALIPLFDPAILTYRMNVSSAISTIALTATARNPKALLAIDYMDSGFVNKAQGVAVSNALVPGGLTLGTTTIRLRVTSEDLKLNTIYTIIVHRISFVATLDFLAPSPVGSGFAPIFQRDRYDVPPVVNSYTLTQPAATGSMVLLPTLSYALASWRYAINTGTYSTSYRAAGTTTPSIPLAVGDTTIKVQVTAEDGDPQAAKVYTVVVHRMSDLSTLSNINSDLGLAPTFDTTLLTYSITAGPTASTVKLTPTTSYYKATLQSSLNGATWVNIVSGTQYPFALATGDNEVRFRCTSEDATLITTYTVQIRRISSDKTLLSLTTEPLGFGLDPIFNPNVNAYSLKFTNPVTTMTVKSTLTYAASTQQLTYRDENLGNLQNGNASQVLNVPVGMSVIKVTVTAENTVTVNDYTINVYRYSRDATLSQLTTSAALVPPFQANVNDYTLNIGFAQSQLTVISRPAYNQALMDLQIDSGAWTNATSALLSSQFPIPVGNSTIRVRVVSEDKFLTNVYVIRIHRMSNDASLNSLQITPPGTGLSPIFAPTYTQAAGYTFRMTVAPAVTSVQITSTLNYPLAVQQWAQGDGGYTAWKSGDATPALNLALGDNRLFVRVYAEDATTNVYAIVVRRLSAATTLASITESSIALSPPFNPNVLSYSMNASSSVATFQFKPVLAADSVAATLLLDVSQLGANYVPQANGVLTPIISLPIGDITVLLKVLAEDGATNRVYSISIHRIALVATLSSMTVMPVGLGLVPPFNTSTFTYSMELLSSDAGVYIIPTLTQPLAVITYNLNGATATTQTAVSGVSTPLIALPFGVTQIQVIVRAEDTVTSNIYRINIHKYSSVSSMAVLNPSQTIAPVFNPTVLTYTLTVAPAVTSINFQPSPTSLVSTMSYTLNGGLSHPIGTNVRTPLLALQVGANTIVFTVWSEDGLYSTIYTISVYRLSDNTNTFSINLDPPGSGLVPVFDNQNQTSPYSFVLAAADSALVLTVIAAYPKARQQYRLNDDPYFPMVYNQTMVTPAIVPPFGFFSITLKVIAEDNKYVRETTINMRRISAQATIPEVVTSNPLVPNYDLLTTDYVTTLAAATSNFTVRFVLASSRANAEWAIGDVILGLAFNKLTLVRDERVNTATGVFTVPAVTGNSTLRLRITSEDTFVQVVYNIRMHRLSADTHLVRLSLPGLTPAFDPNVFSYTALVSATVPAIPVSACMVYAPFATHRLTNEYSSFDQALACNESTMMPVGPGTQAVAIVAIAEDGTVKPYQIAVRQVSADASIAFLDTVSVINYDNMTLLTPLVPSYSASVSDYHVNVSHALSSIQLQSRSGNSSALMGYTLTTWKFEVPVVSPVAYAPNTGAEWRVHLVPGTTLLTINCTSEDKLFSTVVRVWIHRSPLAFHALPLYFVSAAQTSVVMLPTFFNATVRPITVRLVRATNANIVVGTQVIDPAFPTAPLTFVFMSPPNAQILELAWEVTDTATPWDGFGYTAPLAIRVPIVDGRWNYSITPAYPVRRLFVNQTVQLNFTPSVGVEGVIRIDMNWTLNGSPMVGLPDGSGPGSIYFPAMTNNTQFFTARLPSTPGTLVISFVVFGFFALSPITVVVEPRATFSVVGAFVPTGAGELLVQTPYSVDMAPSEVPDLPDGVTLGASLVGGIGGSVGGGWDLQELRWEQGVMSPQAVTFISPTLRTNFSIVFTLSGPDVDHYIVPDPFLLIASDGCDAPESCGPMTRACVSLGGAARFCVCEAGFSGDRCTDVLFTAPATSSNDAPGTNPVAVLSGPAIVNPCDTLLLDGSRSYGMGPLSSQRKFQWRIAQVYLTSSPPAIAAQTNLYSSVTVPVTGSSTSIEFRFQQKPNSAVQHVMASGNADATDLSILYVQGSQLMEGYTYVFSLTVSNSYSVSQAVLLTVAVSSSRYTWAPQVSIQAPPALYPHVASTFSSMLQPSACAALPSDIEYAFSWDVRTVSPASSNLVVNFPSASTGVLQVPAGFFVPNKQYTISVTTRVTTGATDAGGFGSDVGSRRLLALPEVLTQASTSSIAVRIARAPLRARVFGAMRRERFANAPLVLDGSESGDPELEALIQRGLPLPSGNATVVLQYAWTCKLGRSSVPAEATLTDCSLPGTTLNRNVLVVPAGVLPANAWYTFALTILDAASGRFDAAYTEVNVLQGVAGPKVQVNIVDSPRFIELTSELRIQGAAVVSTGTPAERLDYTWTVVPASNGVAGANFNFLPYLRSKDKSNLLVLAPSALVATGGTEFTITLKVCSPNDGTNVCASASTLLAVSGAPSGGNMIVSPTSGVGLNTLFTLTATGWVDPYAQDPLLYVFSYIDTSAAAADQQEIFLTSPSPSPVTTLVLPPGRLIVYVHVVNEQGARTRMEFNRYVLVQRDAGFAVDVKAYANNMTSILLPPIMARKNPALSLGVIMQLSLLSNVMTQRTIDSLNERIILALALGQAIPDIAAERAADTGFALRRKLWALLPSALEWTVSKTGVISVNEEALDPILAHQSLQIVLELNKLPGPRTVAAPDSPVPSQLDLSSSMLRALIAALPPVITGVKAVPSNTTMTVPPVDVHMFNAGVVSRSNLIDMAFRSIVRATSNCTDLAVARDLLLTLLQKENEGAWPGEESVHSYTGNKIGAYSKRANSASLKGPGDQVLIDDALAAEDPLNPLTSLDLMLLSNKPRHDLFFPPTSGLYQLFDEMLTAAHVSSASFDYLSAHPRYEVYLDRLSTSMNNAAFENSSCRTGRADFDGKISVLTNSDMAYSRVQWSHNRSTVVTTTNSSEPPMLDAQLPFSTGLLVFQQPHTFAPCGESFGKGLDGPVVVGLQCAVWSDNDQMYEPQRCVTGTLNENSTVVDCQCSQFGEVGLIYMRDPDFISPPCEVEFGDVWLLAVGVLYGIGGLGLIGVGVLMQRWWVSLAAKGQLMVALTLAGYVAVVRVYLTLQLWVAPRLDSVQVTVLQLLGYVIVHWVWLTAAYHYCRTLDALRTINRRMHSLMSFKPLWSRTPFLPLFLLGLALSICIFFMLLFVRVNKSMDTLYNTVLYVFSGIDFVFGVAALAALLPSTKDDNTVEPFTAVPEEVLAEMQPKKTEATVVRVEESSKKKDGKDKDAEKPDAALSPSGADGASGPLPSPSANGTASEDSDDENKDNKNGKGGDASMPEGSKSKSGSDEDGKPKPSSKTNSISIKREASVTNISKSASAYLVSGATMDKPSAATVRQMRMLAAQRSFAVVHEYLWTKVLPFLSSCCFFALSILSFVAALGNKQLVTNDSTSSTLGLPYILLELFLVGFMMLTCFHSSYVSGLARRFPWPETRESIEARAQAAAEAAQAAAEAAQKKAHEEAVAAAKAAALEAAEAAAKAAKAEAPTGKIAFEVAQAIFQHQQEIIAAGVAVGSPAARPMSDRRKSSKKRHGQLPPLTPSNNPLASPSGLNPLAIPNPLASPGGVNVDVPESPVALRLPAAGFRSPVTDPHYRLPSISEAKDLTPLDDGPALPVRKSVTIRGISLPPGVHVQRAPTLRNRASTDVLEEEEEEKDEGADQLLSVQGKFAAASPSAGPSASPVDDLPVIVEAESPAAPADPIASPSQLPLPGASDEGHFVFDDGAAVDIAATNLPEHRQWGAGRQWVNDQSPSPASAAASPGAPALTATVAPAPLPPAALAPAALPVPQSSVRPGSAGIRLPAVLPPTGHSASAGFPSVPASFPGRAPLPLHSLPMRLPLSSSPPAGASEGSPRVQAVSGSVAGSSRRGSRVFERKLSGGQSGTPPLVSPFGSPSLSARGGPETAATLLLDAAGQPHSSPSAAGSPSLAAAAAPPAPALLHSSSASADLLPHQVEQQEEDEMPPQNDEDPEW